MDKALMALRVALGALFIVAGGLKLGDPLAFAWAIDGYAFLPDRLVTFAAAILPWLEIAAGGALVLGRWDRGGALLVMALMALFLIAAAAALARGLDPACGCFGPSSGRVGAWLIVQDSFLALAAAACLLRRSRASNDVGGGGPQAAGS